MPTGPRGRAAGAARRQGDDDDGHVDEEHRAPPEVAQQEAAEARADGGAEPGDAGPDGDGLGPLLRREHVGEDRQRGRHDEGAAEAHHRAAGDHGRGAVGEGGDGEPAEEDQEAELEGALAAEAVAEAPAGEQQPANTRV